MGGQRNDAVITVDRKMFEKIVDDSNFLDCLKACGVDNWDGYGMAKQMFNEQEEQLDSEEEDHDESID